MSIRVCDIDGCGRKHNARGLCLMHVSRLRKTGSTETSRPSFKTPEEAFAYRTKSVDSGCIEWTGAKTSTGYGHMAIAGKHHKAHRYAWERVNGRIPAGIMVDHLCHNPVCVNVDHLRLVTNAENGQNRRGAATGSKSGIRGVHWDRSARRWKALVWLEGVQHLGGYFTSKEEAGAVAADMRRKLLPFSQN